MTTANNISPGGDVQELRYGQRDGFDSRGKFRDSDRHSSLHRQAGEKNSSFGWADEALIAKYRFLAANEENGNYIISGLLGLSVPTGSDSISSHSTVFTPSMAAGKGWGTRQHGVDIQSTFSASVPDHGQGNIGIPIV
ncbi:MAG: hypothetical protein ACYCY7_02000 [Gallionella sp.]